MRPSILVFLPSFFWWRLVSAKDEHQAFSSVDSEPDARALQLNCPTPPPPPTPRPTWSSPPPPPPYFIHPIEDCGCHGIICHPCRRNLRASTQGRNLPVDQPMQFDLDEPIINEPTVPAAPAPTITITKPGVLILVEYHNEDGTGEEEWQIELDEDEAGDEDELIELPSSIPLDPDDENLVSGETTLFIPSMKVDMEEGLAIAPPNPMAVAQFGTIDPQHRRRRLAKTGIKDVLVVRCSTKSGSPALSRSTISDKVFGTLGDTATLKSRMEECSYDQLCIKPASGGHIWNGVVDVHWNKRSNGKNRNKVKRKCIRQAKRKLGHSLRRNYDHVMVVIPQGTKRGTFNSETNWRAFASVNGYQSTYNDGVIRDVVTQQHEVGHNLGLKHASEGDEEYGDFSGAMGGGQRTDNGAIKCFNAPHSWHLGWYANRHHSIDSDSSVMPTTVTLTGIDNWGTGSGTAVILRIKDGCWFQGKSYYIMYNQAVGVNSGTEEGRNEVMVVRARKNPRKKTWLHATLLTGQSFDMGFSGCDEDVRVTVASISGSTAQVRLEHV